MSNKWLFWFDELGIEDINLVGKKCANLGEMTKAKVAVPPRVCPFLSRLSAVYAGVRPQSGYYGIPQTFRR